VHIFFISPFCLANTFLTGLSTSGYILRLNLTFPAIDAISYLDATNQNLWADGPAQTLVSAVCQGKYVYFGSKSPAASSTILRLNSASNDASSLFTSLGPIATGDLTKGALWGDDGVMFVMEPDGDSPLTFYIASTGGAAGFSLQVCCGSSVFVILGFLSLSLSLSLSFHSD
jgi:hypothetical protein